MALKRSAKTPASAGRLLVALMLAAGIGCASRGRTASSGTASANAGGPASSRAASSSTGARVQEAAFTEDSDGARLVLSANAPLLYTAYEPRPDLLVVDLPGIGLDEKFSAPAASGTLVSSVKVEPIVEMGKPLTRLTIAHREGFRYDIRGVGQGLALSFEAPEQTGSASAAAPVVPPSASAPEPAPAVASAPLREMVVAPSVSARREPAHALEEIRATTGDGEVTIALLGDGSFQAKDFALENPPRIVIDLPGVRNEVRKRAMAVKSELVTRVRVSQFQTAPELVTRIVLDLSRSTPHALRMDGERLSVIVGNEAISIAASTMQPAQAKHAAQAPEKKVAATTVAQVSPVPDRREPASRTEIAPTEVPAPSRVEPAPAAPVEKPAVVEKAAVVEKPAAPAPVPPAPVPAAQASASASPAPAVHAPVPEPAVNAALAPAASNSSADIKARADEAVRTSAPETTTKLPGVRQAHKSRTAPAAAPARPKATPRDEALFEAAAAVLQQEEGARPEGAAGGVPPSSSFQPRTISDAQTQFTGEPISLDLKDADIKDVFRTISQLTQLNIVVDPEVRGTVTVQLEDVPWDQALDLILKQNGLGYVLENNIMRIATTQKLQAEQADRARLSEARQAAEPTRTLIKKLSYARASEITPTIKSVMSKRGDIVVDARTNTLIIREIPTYLPAVLQLIDQLDTATPQVMIESRIVETTKSLGRSLGINWGTNVFSDVAHGNTTNLIFPNNGVGSTRVGLDNGPAVASVRLGNILNSFTLDVALSAAENQGLLKIISSPKVAALTNTAASIQSGVQIPVQTNVNNTTTVIYVDATLRLTVTPQITNEGTILLDVQVSKREPAVALNLSLGQNVPLTIREYRGQILVRDGGTTVIGGIFQINDQDQNNMIPGLWKIPILGNLFRNKTRTEKHDELLIFITPRILRS
ncbi:MAG: type IV pilus secretin PilQ [Acidobacteriota bacterium]|nr:type IV pilus secretin PilQ [Acidobacteriota bacterium]